MPKVLVVDDETEIRQMLLKYLKREGICGIECENGTEALAYLKENAVNLVILDIMMAGMDGFEVLKQIRQRMGEIPVILLSARQEEYDKVLGLGLGADDYVTKPFSPGEMMARVKVQLRKGMKIEKKAERILEADGLRMDTESCQVTVDGREVVLAGKEFWLLKFFMEHPGQGFIIMCGRMATRTIIRLWSTSVNCAKNWKTNRMREYGYRRFGELDIVLEEADETEV